MPTLKFYFNRYTLIAVKKKCILVIHLLIYISLYIQKGVIYYEKK
nr:MAG TPA: hypothetical protein [Inoviridae sp.]